MKCAKGIVMVSILLTSVLALAGNLTYSEQADVSGTLGGVPFTNEHMVIWLSGFNPDSVTDDGNGWYFAFASIEHPMTFTIGGSPYYYFTDPTRFDVHQVALWGGVHDSNPEGGIMITWSDTFATYDLKSPFWVSGDSQCNMELIFGTTGGDLIITNMGNSTFGATWDTPVPEPGSLVLAVSGFFGLAAVLRRRMLG
jgi:PEP-CTERM motif